MPKLVDLHCHLDLYPNHAAAVAECEHSSVYTVAVTTTPKAWPRNRDLTAGTRYVRPALGLHPQLVGERADELELWLRYLPQARFVGEVGLDGSPRHAGSLALQSRVFGQILQRCAELGGKILSLHSTRAVRTVLDMVETIAPPGRNQMVLHWFTGTRSEAMRAIALGCYFSINAAMLRTDKHRAWIQELPLSRVLTETDGPFTQPKNTGMRAANVEPAVEMLAKARGIAKSEMIEQILSNLRTLLSTVESSGLRIGDR